MRALKLARNPLLLGIFLLTVVSIVYLPHFHNAFHFDDVHTVMLNPHIREIRNLPRFFTDARLFSVLPSNRVYRPVVSASLAVDYWLGDGLKPLFFHISTFCWFSVQLAFMFLLFRKVADWAHPDPRNDNVALFATAWYGLHPAMAETVNYVIQRADLYSTLGVVAGILVYARFPGLRKYGLYMLPVALGILSKPPALVFPAILFAYIWLFEFDGSPGRLKRAVFACAPALVATALLGYLLTAMNLASFHVSPDSAYSYRITQPLVALRYFQTFFAPSGLTADTDHLPEPSIWTDFAWAGFLFLIAVIAAAIVTARKREWRPVSFGLWWFVLALAPTSLFPLGEVENDHRMFFPFVGLVLAATWLVALLVYRGILSSPLARAGLITLCAVELLILSVGTVQRNVVWRTSESLWKDVTVKSPRNGRGLMNYGLTLIEKGDYENALIYLNRAKAATRNYALVECNLGVAHAKLKHNDEAEKHFLEGLRLNPTDLVGRFLYARWLDESGRTAEAERHAIECALANSDFLEPVYLLLQISAKRGDWQQVRKLSAGLLKRFPSEPDATAYRLMVTWKTKEVIREIYTAENFLSVSALYYLVGSYDEAIAAAREALSLRPDYPEAYSNIASAQRAQEKWELAADSARQALKLRPGFETAQKNLARAEARKKDSNTR